MSFRSGTAAIVLEDGRIFRGSSFGAQRDADGEVVFTTSMTGYQEVATDPSFRGQIVCMTYPIIGNYGVTADDAQSRQPWISGMIVREYNNQPSNWRSEGTLDAYFKAHDIPGISGVDTRALTRHIRQAGAMRGAVLWDVGSRSDAEITAAGRNASSPADRNVVAEVSVDEQQQFGHGDTHVVLLDCGVKQNILDSLERRGARVTLVPFDTPAQDILALNPHGVLTSPGPGDPTNAGRAQETVKAILDANVPYLGVCLGHQLLALAIGATTSKLKYGHHGGNHPVQDLESGRVYITAQNHGYQVDADSVPETDGWRVSQVSLNDGSVEGLRHVSRPVFSIQYHPEGSPGPQDTQEVFDRFVALLHTHKGAD